MQEDGTGAGVGPGPNPDPATARDGLSDRITRTLEVMAARDYNPTVAMLGRMLMGGSMDQASLEVALAVVPNVHVEDGFVYLDGRRYVERCRHRVRTNGHLSATYRRIAELYTADLVRLCPWVKCVMLVGSAATGGLCRGDDLDLNIVVEDGRKYTTLAMSTILNRRYALRYGSELGFSSTGPNVLPMFMCLNIIWEERETHPFGRRDEQMAYELFTGIVLHGHDHHRSMLASNGWLEGFFPQMYDGWGSTGLSAAPRPSNGNDGNGSSVGLVERLVRGVMFSYDRMARLYLTRRPEVLELTEYYERIKHPYGLYDLPRGPDDGHEGG